MKNIKRLFTLLTLLLMAQFLAACGNMKGVSMMNSSEALQDSNIPFQKDISVSMKAHMLVVDVFINDSTKPYKFILDTGSMTVITEKTAAGLKFTDETKISVKDIAGNAKDAKMVSIAKFGIPGLEVSNLAAVVTDLDKFDTQIDGILGSNYLQYFNIAIDYQKPSLLISNRAPAVLPENSIVIPFKKNMKFGFAPTAKCNVDGVSLPCMIDTGYPGAFSIPSSKASKLPSFKHGNYIQSNGSLVQGSFDGTNGHDYAIFISKLGIEDYELQNLVISSNNFEKSMTIGKAFLDDFTFSIDYPNNKLYLTPKSDKHNEFPFLTYGFGIDKTDSGKATVNGMWPDTQATKAGIQIGDEILTINRKDPKELGMLQIMEIFFKKQNINVEFKNQAGEVRQATLGIEDLTKRVDR